MDQFLVDSNILIYLLNKNRDIISFFEQYRSTALYISMISWIEVLSGSSRHKKTIHEVERDIQDFIRLPVEDRIAKAAAQLFENAILKGRKINNFQDGVIAATALLHHMPLITNNPKDFRKFKGLKVISPKKIHRK